jgi:hypothetical protein
MLESCCAVLVRTAHQYRAEEGPSGLVAGIKTATEFDAQYLLDSEFA